MKVAATLLILCLDLIAGQTPKRLQIASMTAKIGRDGTGKLKFLNILKINVLLYIKSWYNISIYDPLPYHFLVIDDAVSIKVCSDVNIADCCSETENWEPREFNECKNKNF